MAENHEVQTAHWINVVPLNRREKIARWWIEDVRQGSTYISRRSHETPFQTVVPVDAIDKLTSDGLRHALQRQVANVENDDSVITYPRATVDGSQYFGSVLISRRTLGVRFTTQGPIDISGREDENN